MKLDLLQRISSPAVPWRNICVEYSASGESLVSDSCPDPPQKPDPPWKWDACAAWEAEKPMGKPVMGGANPRARAY
jgi:hypothetical protein